MKSNLFWQVYKNLEREFLSIAEVIHIDDKQLDVYSMRIADLLVRTVVEIETLAKELYLTNGGAVMADEDMYFDTVCMAHLNGLWNLDKKVVHVVSPIIFFEKEENIVLRPLHKAHKRGTSSSDWNKAYQAVKHDRVKELSKGNIKFFLHGLAALYVLNLYYKDDKYLDLTMSAKNDMDSSFGSSLFSVKVHKINGIFSTGEYYKSTDYDECVFIEDYEPTTKEIVLKTLAVKVASKERFIKAESERLEKEKIAKGETPTLEWKEEIRISISQKVNTALQKDNSISDCVKNLLFDVVLNKQQY